MPEGQEFGAIFVQREEEWIPWLRNLCSLPKSLPRLKMNQPQLPPRLLTSASGTCVFAGWQLEFPLGLLWFCSQSWVMLTPTQTACVLGCAWASRAARLTHILYIFCYCVTGHFLLAFWTPLGWGRVVKGRRERVWTKPGIWYFPPGNNPWIIILFQ